MATVANTLADAIPRLDAAGVEAARLNAELLLAYVLQTTRSRLWTYPERQLTSEEEAAFESLLERRLRREPLAYLLGEWEFYGRSFLVSPDVLIPRPETELLVEEVLRWAREQGAKEIVDVGTGSGAIAVTLALEMPSLHVMAVDLSPAALDWARKNAARHGVEGRITYHLGDLLQSVPAGTHFDAIVANLPYIEEEEIAHLMPEVRAYEPLMALSGGQGGLELILRLIDESAKVLSPGGLLALELGMGQADAVSAHLQELGWRDVHIVEDYAGIARHVFATFPE